LFINKIKEYNYKPDKLYKPGQLWVKGWVFIENNYTYGTFLYIFETDILFKSANKNDGIVKSFIIKLREEKINELIK
jgi:hypothetical protein